MKDANFSQVGTKTLRDMNKDNVAKFSKDAQPDSPHKFVPDPDNQGICKVCGSYEEEWPHFGYERK